LYPPVYAIILISRLDSYYEVAMSETNANLATEASEFGYGQLFSVLWRRRFWFLGVFSVAIASSLLLALREKPSYQSSMQLLVEPNYQRLQVQVGINNQSNSSNTQEDFATQINLMRSQQFIQKTVDVLQAEYPDLQPEEVSESLALNQLSENDTLTKIFVAVYTADDPVKTQRVLEALQQVYQDYNVQQQELRLNRGLTLINKQLQESRENLIQAQEALERFLGQYGLTEPKEQSSSILSSLNRIRQEQEETTTQYQDTQARYNALQQQLALTPQQGIVVARLSQSSRYQALLNQLQEIDLALANRLAVYTENDDNVQILRDRRQNLLRLLRQEVNRILGSSSPQSIDDQELDNGQLSPTELELVNQLVELRTNLIGLNARNRSLATIQRQLQKELSQFPSLIATYERLQPAVESERTNLQQLLALRQELSAELAQGGFTWQVVEPPTLGQELEPSFGKTVLLGAVIGLFLGGIAAFLREATDGAVHTAADLEQQSRLPLLGVLPELPQLSNTNDPVNASQASSVFPLYASKQGLVLREALDFICKNIQFLNSDSPIRSLAITSTLADEGKSAVAVGLALSAARLAQHILLIDANLKFPVLHEFLHLPNDVGLATLLEDETTSFCPTRFAWQGITIDVLTAGSVPDDSIRLLSSRRMKELIQDCESKYDLIVLDTPSALGTVDTIQIASVCQGVLMLGRLHHITKPQLTQAVSILSKFNVIGILASGCKNAETMFNPSSKYVK
jgi:polysaccharide biosynthesis transport protein